MVGRVLLDDDTYKVVRTIFGAYQVTLKRTGMTVKAPAFFRQYFDNAVDIFRAKAGKPDPQDPRFLAMVDDFAEAVFGGEARVMRFVRTSPEDFVAGHL